MAPQMTLSFMRVKMLLGFPTPRRRPYLKLPTEGPEPETLPMLKVKGHHGRFLRVAVTRKPS